MQDHQRNLMGRYIADRLSLEEATELLEWLNADPAREIDLKEMQDVWDKSRDYPEILNIDTQSAWVKVKRSVQSSGLEQGHKKISFSGFRQTIYNYIQAFSKRFF